MPIHPRSASPTLSDILDLAIQIVPIYGVEHNTFVFEAAQIPVFAEFLRNARADLCNYVWNPAYDDARGGYEAEAHMRLGRRINATLGLDDEAWFR